MFSNASGQVCLDPLHLVLQTSQTIFLAYVILLTRLSNMNSVFDFVIINNSLADD